MVRHHKPTKVDLSNIIEHAHLILPRSQLHGAEVQLGSSRLLPSQNDLNSDVHNFNHLQRGMPSTIHDGGVQTNVQDITCRIGPQFHWAGGFFRCPAQGIQRLFGGDRLGTIKIPGCLVFDGLVDLGIGCSADVIRDRSLTLCTAQRGRRQRDVPKKNGQMTLIGQYIAEISSGSNHLQTLDV